MGQKEGIYYAKAKESKTTKNNQTTSTYCKQTLQIYIPCNTTAFTTDAQCESVIAVIHSAVLFFPALFFFLA